MKQEIPKGFCQCGCGQRTRLAPYTWARKSMKKGEPVRFISGHQLRISHGKTGENHPQWKGGKTHDANGHAKILRPNHPKAGESGYVHEYVLIAERALGKYLPLKAVVHHHTPEQLVICENQAYHKFIHQRTKALRACGHASWRKCNYCHQYDDPQNLRFKSRAIYHDRRICPAFNGRN